MDFVILDKVNEVLGEMKLQSEKVAESLLLKKQDKELIFFYALGFLAENYVKMAEEYLKQGGDYEPTYFSAKAEEIRQICSDVFGRIPEREYYKSLYYKAVPGARTAMPLQQIQQLAQFAAANVLPDQEVSQEPELLARTVRELLKKHGNLLHSTGIEARLINVLNARFKKLREKPSKMSGLYEVLLLWENVEKIIEMLKEKEKEERKARREERRGRKPEAIPGFKV